MSVFGVWCGGEGGGGAGLAGDGGEEEVEEEKEVEEEESSLAYRLKQLSPGLGGRESSHQGERDQPSEPGLHRVLPALRLTADVSHAVGRSPLLPPPLLLIPPLLVHLNPLLLLGPRLNLPTTTIINRRRTQILLGLNLKQLKVVNYVKS